MLDLSTLNIVIIHHLLNSTLAFWTDIYFDLEKSLDRFVRTPWHFSQTRRTDERLGIFLGILHMYTRSRSIERLGILHKLVVLDSLAFYTNSQYWTPWHFTQTRSTDERLGIFLGC